MANLIWIIPCALIIGAVCWGICDTSRRNAETARNAAEFRREAHLELHQFLVEVDELKAGKCSYTSRKRGFWLSGSGGVFHMHWMGSSAELSQQVTAGFDVTRWAEIKLGLR